jgi:hypothetical protein
MNETPDCPVAHRFRPSYLAFVDGFAVGVQPSALQRAFHEDAVKRTRKGHEQTLCTHCQRWVWQDRAKACPNFKREEAT